MAYAPLGTDFPRGSFHNAETDVHFEFTAASAEEQVFGAEFDVKVWVRDDSFRLARVVKTRAYVVVDEDEFGQPVVERWVIKRRHLAAA